MTRTDLVLGRLANGSSRATPLAASARAGRLTLGSVGIGWVVSGGELNPHVCDLQLCRTGTASYRLAHALATRNGTNNRFGTPNGGSK